MRFRRLRIWLSLATLPMALVSCSGCLTAFESATWGPRAGQLVNGRAAVVYSSRYEIDLAGLEGKHRFDIHKYRRIAQALVRAGYLRASDIYVPAEVSEEELLQVHTPAYLAALRDSKTVGACLEVKLIGLLPNSTADSHILEAFRVATGGTVLAARLALRSGLGINLGGGYHHAHADHGEGFCVYADIPITIRSLRSDGLARRVVVVDLDVHQGNGDARILAGDPDVFTFDIHQENIYPRPKATNDLDVPLLPPVDDARYLAVLREHLPGILDRQKPDLVILQGGVDVYKGDTLASFALTAEGIVARDEYVVGEARRRDIPVLYVTGGGYSPDAWRIQYRSVANLLEKFAGAQRRPCLDSKEPPPTGEAAGK